MPAVALRVNKVLQLHVGNQQRTHDKRLRSYNQSSYPEYSPTVKVPLRCIQSWSLIHMCVLLHPFSVETITILASLAFRNRCVLKFINLKKPVGKILIAFPYHFLIFRWEFYLGTLWLFNIAMENPSWMEVSSWENHLFLWTIYTMAMLVITRGYPIAWGPKKMWPVSSGAPLNWMPHLQPTRGPCPGAPHEIFRQHLPSGKLTVRPW